MSLEQIYVFPINAPLTAAKRLRIEQLIQEKTQDSGKELTYKWIKRGEEKLLRAEIDPVTLEVIFNEDRVELFATAPAWAKLLFTKAKKAEIKSWIEQTLIDAELLTDVAEAV